MLELQCDMLKRVKISIQILKDETAKLWQKINQIKKEEQEIVHEINRKKDEENIKNIKNKLGIQYGTKTQ